MDKEFEVAREFEADATPQQVWEAVTTGTAGWLWPLEYEPGVGGAGPFGGTVTAWDPPRRLTTRTEDVPGIDTQSVNQLDYEIAPRDAGRRAWVRYVHSGIFTDDWDNQYDGADRHTDFYLHTLRQYVAHFPGRTATHLAVDGPADSAHSGATAVLERGLGLPRDAAVGDEVRVTPSGLAPVTAVLDYRNAHFVGLRADDALYRFFCRQAWGGPVQAVVHHMAPDVDATAVERAWHDWLHGLFH
ncbi:SRPBCC family protein [Streptomyces sp. NPDC054784]